MTETDKQLEQRAAEIERIIGRKPTLREIERNDLDRPDTRTVRDKVFAEARRTVPMAPPDDPLIAQLQAQKAELQKAAEWEAYSKSSPAERRVKDFEKLIADRSAEKAANQQSREHLNTMAADLAPLRQLRETMRWNPDYSIEQIEQVEYAIRIGETPGHDPNAFRKFRDDVLGAEDARIEQAKFERSARITALQNEIAELERTRPQRVIAPADDVSVADKLTEIRAVKDARVQRLKDAGNDAAADIVQEKYNQFRTELTKHGTSDAALALVDSEYQKAEGGES